MLHRKNVKFYQLQIKKRLFSCVFPLERLKITEQELLRECSKISIRKPKPLKTQSWVFSFIQAERRRSKSCFLAFPQKVLSSQIEQLRMDAPLESPTHAHYPGLYFSQASAKCRTFNFVHLRLILSSLSSLSFSLSFFLSFYLFLYLLFFSLISFFLPLFVTFFVLLYHAK